MRTIEWEMPYWNLGHTFDYAEMTYLMFPRPFMVERGHHDGVGRDQWVAHEFAKVRFLYAQFGMSDRVDIEFFQGGHSINGRGTFDFLQKHLNWPVPDSEQWTCGGSVVHVSAKILSGREDLHTFWLRSFRVMIALGFSPRTAIT